MDKETGHTRQTSDALRFTQAYDKVRFIEFKKNSPGRGIINDNNVLELIETETPG